MPKKRPASNPSSNALDLTRIADDLSPPRGPVIQKRRLARRQGVADLKRQASIPMGILVLIIGIGYLPLQIAAWKKWQGTWFYLSFIPAGIPVVAGAVGLAQGSNLWPFWAAFALPGSAVVLGVIWFFRWLMQRMKEKNA